MRIIGGVARGRLLKTREGKGTRPTDARSREAIFNILAERVMGARVLDLYAGSGAIGIEALSRGASHATFIEQNAVAARCIKENLRSVGFLEKGDERGEVWTANVKSALGRLTESGAQFEIIFADPPFTRETELQELCAVLDKCAQLLHNVQGRFAGLMMIQHHWKAPIDMTASGISANSPDQALFRLVQQRRAGESFLSFFELNIEN
jgi:16S rRNA (guanine(966)-N(2))-methyltransferase RsmD